MSFKYIQITEKFIPIEQSQSAELSDCPIEKDEEPYIEEYLKSKNFKQFFYFVCHNPNLEKSRACRIWDKFDLELKIPHNTTYTKTHLDYLAEKFKNKSRIAQKRAQIQKHKDDIQTIQKNNHSIEEWLKTQITKNIQESVKVIDLDGSEYNIKIDSVQDPQIKK